MLLQLAFDPDSLADTSGSLGALLCFDPPPAAAPAPVSAPAPASAPAAPPTPSPLAPTSLLPALDVPHMQPARATLDVDARQVLLRTVLPSDVFRKLLNVDPWRTLVDRPFAHRGGGATLDGDVTGDVPIGQIHCPPTSETSLHARRSTCCPADAAGFLWSWDQVADRVRRHWDLTPDYASFILAFSDKPAALAWNQASWDACWSMYIRYNTSPTGNVRWRLRTARIVFRSPPRASATPAPRPGSVIQRASAARSPLAPKRVSVNTTSHHSHRPHHRRRCVPSSKPCPFRVQSWASPHTDQATLRMCAAAQPDPWTRRDRQPRQQRRGIVPDKQQRPRARVSGTPSLSRRRPCLHSTSSTWHSADPDTL